MLISFLAIGQAGGPQKVYEGAHLRQQQAVAQG